MNSGMEAINDLELTRRAEALGAALVARKWRAVTAESCTGGWIAKAFTDIPGSSAWFEGGLVTYSNALKSRWLGVPDETLESDGAVSEAVVRAMARGALDRSGVDVAVAVSGVAGPDGGSADKPVGLVWFSWCRRDGDCQSLAQRFAGNREAVRRQTVALALGGILAFCEGRSAESALEG